MTVSQVQMPVFPDLKGKAVLITGASTGLGAAAAEGFARSGARVAVHYNASRDKAEQVAERVRAAGGEAVIIGGDLTRREAPAAILAATLEAFGGLDILVNNAGGLVKRLPITDYSDEFYDAVLDLNVRHVVNFMTHAVPVMLAQSRPASIINVSSIAARHGGAGGSVLYAAAKGFISTATHGWAKELAQTGIRVNAVSPGVIETPFHDRYSTPAQLTVMQATIPMGRLGVPDECVGTFLYLASEAASGYVTGQVIEVNGGQYMP
ncbi:SDR family oxidoreductase [Xanthobacter sp. DSM 24535]|uniref:SDR family NAD(P)-dependent oxidoreductase n=1 Tax=Roseixanthobacter psychrophilus TaxID=3119917 RepID=UPI00372AF551